MVYVIFWRVCRWEAEDLCPTLSSINLIIYKGILACSTSMAYKSLLCSALLSCMVGFFSSSLFFPLPLLFFLKELGATDSSSLKDSGCDRRGRVTGGALQKPALEIQPPATGSTWAPCRGHVVPQDRHCAPGQVQQQAAVNFTTRL